MIPLTLYGPTKCLVNFSNLLPFICHFKSFVLSSTKSPTLYSSPSPHFLFMNFFISSYAFSSITFASF